MIMRDAKCWLKVEALVVPLSMQWLPFVCTQVLIDVLQILFTIKVFLRASLIKRPPLSQYKVIKTSSASSVANCSFHNVITQLIKRETAIEVEIGQVKSGSHNVVKRVDSSKM